VQVSRLRDRPRHTGKPKPAKASAKKKTAKKDAALAATAADFADWLGSASADDIKKYAQSINTFFESRGLDVDGVGYDFEFDQLNTRHRANLALLYQETSRAVAHHNGLVSYANAPFKEDGVNSYGFMQVQPFALAATAPNLLARPMCFDAVNSTSLADIQSSIACALRDPADPTKKGGAGLHPSQVQFASQRTRCRVGSTTCAEQCCARIARPACPLSATEERGATMLRKCKA
jgi:hypothetical protein